ncbi:MAG: S8 family serine peptidase, partial [Deltaproteobacteria bacterium]|nr:S8 family serine peptidase [Deltaproteobacteria bacterium]
MIPENISVKGEPSPVPAQSPSTATSIFSSMLPSSSHPAISRRAAGSSEPGNVHAMPGCSDMPAETGSRTASAVAAAALALALCLGFTEQAAGDSADSFRTQEYLAGKGLDAIRAAEAYAMGYSGKGVTVGVLDGSAFPQHVEFYLKTPYPVEYFVEPDPSNWHGVHVAGTIAASRDGYGIHGVAYGASLVSMIATDGDTLPEYDHDDLKEASDFAFVAFQKYRNVNIINNSWATDMNLGTWLQGDPERLSEATSTMTKTALSMSSLVSGENGMLFVFAAGNEGASTPALPAHMPSWLTGTTLIGGITMDPTDDLDEFLDTGTITTDNLRDLARSVISVSAFDPAKATDRIDFIMSFSNLSEGSAHYTILAPGHDIYSSVGPGPLDYDYKSGTSMAAPHVSGVAALVKEAFPWMTGIQLADTLLSTATPLDSLDGLPPFVVRKFFYHDDVVSISIIAPESNVQDFVNSEYVLNHEDEVRSLLESMDLPETVTLEKLQEWLTTMIEKGRENDDPKVEWEEISGSTRLYSKHFVSDSDYLSLFGMGIVNAYDAVRGPAWLDANRLTEDDLENVDGIDYAMYGVDTRGHDSVWYHDISQVKVGSGLTYPNGAGAPVPEPNWINEILEGRDVGLRKDGPGTLTLAGANTFAGPTLINGGLISLGMRGQVDGEASLAGDVRINENGSFTGNGTVSGDLVSEGTVLPGLVGTPGTVLTVGGDLKSTGGSLKFAVGSQGLTNMLAVQNQASIENTSIELFGIEGGAMPAAGYDIIRANALQFIPLPDGGT